MRLVTYNIASQPIPRLAVRVGHRVLDVEAASRVDGEPLPNTLRGLLKEGRGAVSRVQALAKAAQSSAGRFSAAMHEERAIRFLPPLPETATLLDLRAASAGGEPSAFPRTAGEFVGHNGALAAAGSTPRCMPAPVFVLGRTSSDIEPDDAMDRIVGMTLQFDLVDESGAALAGHVLGPEFVTMDEMGDPEDMWISCTVNGTECLRVNTGALPCKLPEALARATMGATLHPGDMIALGFGAAEAGRAVALRRGDVVECTIDGVMSLRATIAAAP
jgi:hypothetical protein